MTRIARLLLPLGVSILLLATCSHSQVAESGPQPHEPRFTLVVHNGNWSDAIVYQTYPGLPRRIGDVVTFKTERFHLRVPPEGTVSFQVVLRGENRQQTYFNTGPLTVRDGQVITIRVQNLFPTTAVS